MLFSRSYQNGNNYAAPAPVQPSTGYNAGGSYNSNNYGYTSSGQGGYEQDTYG